MRLLKRERSGWLASSHTFSLIDYNPQADALPYAILSHRWGKDEVTYQDLQQGTAKKKAGGYQKLQFCAEQAAHDGLMYFWVDTCCIDKSNNTELSEAINSMYKWYQSATKCYVYLPDVLAKQERELRWEAAFRKSEWFKRGWTLQELVAPRVVEFFSKEGTKIGDKTSLLEQIQQATGISIEALQGKPLLEISEQERFSWTARRQTTVDEDAVYCLLGIFNVHMPLIYGEGQQKALARLQREIRLLDNPDLFAIKEAAWVVPFERNARFTGRDDQFAELEEKLTADTSTRKIAVVGLGGIGKTQLVLELLYRYKEKYRSCSIMWIATTSRESIKQGYLKVAQQLKIPGCDDQEVDAKGLVQDYLSRDETGSWLLVYDNADDIDLWITPWTPMSNTDREELSQRSSSQPQRLIDYLPQSKHGCIIFTTRNKRAAVKLASSNIITVPAMSKEAAVRLLAVSLVDTSLIQDSQTMSQLLATLTYLPLAISQAAAYINTNDIILADYLSLLEGKEEDVIEVLSENFEDYGRYQDIKNPIVTTWLVSFEQIRRSSPLAAEYLSFMACIDFRDIPLSLLPPGTSRKEEIDAIGTLTAYSFVNRQPTNTLLDLHRLVHLTTRNWLRKKGSLHEWTETTVRRIKEVLPEQAHEHENRAIWRTYLLHAQQVLTLDLISEDREQSIELLWKYGRCLNSDGRWREAEAIFSQILAVQRKQLSEDSNDVLTATAWLASTYWEQGWWEEAEQLEVQVMETYKTKLGADHPDTLTSIHNLASTYMNQGRWEEAEQLLVQVVETYKTKLGADHPHMLTSMHNLASTYMNQGRWEEAEQLFVQVVETRKTKLGADHPHMLTSMHNLASTYMNQGRWEEAEQLLVQVVETYKTKLGADHPHMLTSMHNLASTYMNQGRWEEAEQLFVQVVETRKTKLGADHPHMLTSMHNLASTYMNQGRWEEAEQLLVQVVETYKTKLGADHPHMLTSMHNLASTYMNQGRSEEAEQLFVQVVETRKTKLGADHPHMLTSMHNLASIYMNQGRSEEAEQLLVQVVETYKTKLGADHPGTLISMHNLAYTWKDLGRDEEALQLIRDCVERRSRALGVEHPDYIRSYQTLIDWDTDTTDSDSDISIEEAFGFHKHIKGKERISSNVNGTDVIYGQTGQVVNLVRVRWLWLILPYGLCLAGILFLLLTAYLSRQAGAPLWKSSINALFYHGIDYDHGAFEPLTTIAEMDEQASQTTAVLRSSSITGKLMLETTVTRRQLSQYDEDEEVTELRERGK